jgi:tetratricopeptide (TPR) repeat protein
VTAELELTVIQPAAELGYVAGFAITDELIHVAGGTSSAAPFVLASSNAKRFERMRTPRELGLRGIAVHRGEVWSCGEFGQLARSSDHGATWKLVPTQTDACMFAIAAIGDDLWLAGDRGFCARMRGTAIEPIDLGTRARLAAIYEHDGDVIVVSRDGVLQRWRAGELKGVPTGATTGLTGVAITKRGTWIAIGDRGFITRSPDGAWFSRSSSGTDADLEAVLALPDGRVVIVGDRGAILISTDDGRTWHPHEAATTAHLWTLARFGDGVLIGGDGGLIAKLAPAGDATWADRPDVFVQRDAWIAAGPDGFVEQSLTTILEDEPEDEDGGDGDDDDADDDDDEDGDDDGDDDADDADDTDGEVFHTRAFAATYGIEAAPELVALDRALAQRHLLGLALRFSPPSGNAFEQLILREQRDPHSTALAEAFAGVVALGGGHCLELYGWDAPRQVLRFDTGAQTLAVVADSLDSFAYAAVVARKRLDGDRAELAARALAGRISPDDPERRDTEFLLCRARWLRALLRGERRLAELFDADLNQIVPADQLRARLAACERYVPTALYSLWRAFWFEEPELARYLEVARAHRAGLVRDAATLVDELLAGRNQLGAIDDVRAHGAAFRALGLEPRRTSRAAEELAQAPRARWTELAWRALDDADALRVVLEQSVFADHVAAVVALRDLPEHDRRIAIPKLADQLPAELEPVLVGSLLRSDPAELAVAPHDEPGDDRVRVALRMTERAIRIAPAVGAIQHAHAMRMIDAEEAGLAGKLDALLRAATALEPSVRVEIALRLASSARVATAIDAAVAASDELDRDDLLDLGELILHRAPDRFAALMIPDDVDALCALAGTAVAASQREHALALFERLLALPIPDGGDARGNYLHALDQARAIEAFDIAARIADRAQPIGPQHPDLFHSAARAYAAVGEYGKAFQQVKLAFEHDYARLGQVETDEHLGPVRELPEFKALFQDWHARQDGN